jgi:hypothetical protein
MSVPGEPPRDQVVVGIQDVDGEGHEDLDLCDYLVGGGDSHLARRVLPSLARLDYM